jgi:hypothetical protein
LKFARAALWADFLGGGFNRELVNCKSKHEDETFFFVLTSYRFSSTSPQRDMPGPLHAPVQRELHMEHGHWQRGAVHAGFDLP